MSTKAAPMFEVTSLIKTKNDAVRFMNKIDEVINDLFNLKVKIEDLLEKKLSYTEKKFILDIAKNNSVSISTVVPFQQLLIKLKEYMATIPEVELSLSFDPSKEIIDSISNWFSLNLGKDVFLAIVVDQTIMGGALIGYNGTYKDYSLKKMLRDTISKNPALLTLKQ